MNKTHNEMRRNPFLFVRTKPEKFPLKCYLFGLFILAVVCQFLTIASWRVPEDAGIIPPTPVDRQRCEAIILQLTKALSKDPERNALRNLDLQLIGNETIAVEGLTPAVIRRAFHGRRIALLGDSTLYYFTKWLHALFHHTKSKSTYHPRDLSNLTAANTEVLADVQETCKISSEESCVPPIGHGPPPPVRDEVNGLYHMQWAGMSGIMDNWKTEQFLSKMWKVVANDIRPDVMVVNMGMHWLHFYDVARNTGPEAILRWVHYEDWLQQVLDKARQFRVKVLLFKTTNLVCDRKLTGQYADGLKRYNILSEKGLQECESSVRLAFSKSDLNARISGAEITSYCVNGTLNNKGSTLLNRRLEQFVSGIALQPGMYVGTFNDHDVQHCDYTAVGDGLHYHFLNLLRVRLLANYLQCATPES